MNTTMSAPTSVNLEITDVCNVRCRHCYNFWREKGGRRTSMSRESMGLLIERLVEAKVFHVVFSGGEPFTRFDTLEYGLKLCKENNISVSCNSNLMLATDEKLKRLANLGLDHILTSLNSYDEQTNDFIVNRPGAFKLINKGIETALRNGVRVSVNLIVSRLNSDHVYETGKFVHNLGCQKIFGTRLVPPVASDRVDESYIIHSKSEAMNTVDQLVRVKRDTGIMIGTLVSYPLCVLGDLERYIDFVGRGCPAQAGHRMNINANGDTHCCVHEEHAYGNVFEIGVMAAYENMETWRTGGYTYKGCENCDYLEICRSGCRMSSLAYSGRMDGPDQLMVGPEAITKPLALQEHSSVLEKIELGIHFSVPQRLRFRQEQGYSLLNIRWANTIRVTDEVAQFLQKYQKSGEEFTIADLGKGKGEILAHLFLKDAVETKDVQLGEVREKTGLSLDPMALKQNCVASL